MAAPRECPRCRRGLPDDAPDGLCPPCLLAAGLGANTSPLPAITAGHPAPAGEAPAEGAVRAALGRRFPFLQIGERIGRGGMGEVWYAYHPDLKREVAIKVLAPGPGADPAFAARFAREAQAMARLKHPRIVPVYDFGEGDGLYFLVMEYQPQNLRQRMAAEDFRRPVPGWEITLGGDWQVYDATARWVRGIVGHFLQVCEAVEYAHAQGVVHRDVKPENVLCGPEGVKLTDFGLARLLSAPEDGRLTSAYQVMGTPNYMAPEQRESTAKVDQRADVYSLGVLLYELLTGRLPEGHFEPPSAYIKDRRLDAVVRKALARDPIRRYQSVWEMKHDLQEVERKARLTAVLGDAWAVCVWCLLPLWVCWGLRDQFVFPWWAQAGVLMGVGMRGGWYTAGNRLLAEALAYFGLFAYTAWAYLHHPDLCTPSDRAFTIVMLCCFLMPQLVGAAVEWRNWWAGRLWVERKRWWLAAGGYWGGGGGTPIPVHLLRPGDVLPGALLVVAAMLFVCLAPPEARRWLDLVLSGLSAALFTSEAFLTRRGMAV
jgi:hypothetical protein